MQNSRQLRRLADCLFVLAPYRFFPALCQEFQPVYIKSFLLQFLYFYFDL